MDESMACIKKASTEVEAVVPGIKSKSADQIDLIWDKITEGVHSIPHPPPHSTHILADLQMYILSLSFYDMLFCQISDPATMAVPDPLLSS